jgi:inhibitor of KinA
LPFFIGKRRKSRRGDITVEWKEWMGVLPRILPAGDQAILVEFGREISPSINTLVHAFAQKARELMIPGIRELVPAYCTILIYYDPFHLSYSETVDWIHGVLAGGPLDIQLPSAVKKIPVLYGGPYGPDISFVAEYNKITPEEVVQYHTSRDYRVYVIGFSPGFAALGTVPQEIETPRLPSPRVRVPAGSVGIGGLQTGVYSVESPGGWRLIGRCPVRLFNLEQDPPSYLQAGDQVRFYSIREEEYIHWGKGNLQDETPGRTAGLRL